MLKKLTYTILSLSILLLAVSSCKYQKLLKSSDFELKYEKAISYYEKEDYLKAQTILEELLTIYKGSKKGEEVFYYYAYSYYGQENFILAGYHFRSFAKTYPYSKHSEECEYLSAYCFYLDSPEPSLDQTNTFRAIDELQLFINKYPESERIEECNKLIDDLRQKLEDKSYENAKLYFKLSEYKAAIVALKNSLNEFPDMDNREEVLYMILKSSFELAEYSVESKKKERYQATVNEYYALLDAIPKSDYIKDAEDIYEKTLKALKK